VLSGLVVPFTDTDRRGNAEQFGAYIDKKVPLKRRTPRMAIWNKP
jgi:hypothetical protein